MTTFNFPSAEFEALTVNTDDIEDSGELVLPEERSGKLMKDPTTKDVAKSSVILSQDFFEELGDQLSGPGEYTFCIDVLKYVT